MNAPRFVHLYDGLEHSAADLAALARFLAQALPRTAVDVRDPFIRHWLTMTDGDEGLAETLAVELASARVTRPDRREPLHEPLPGEVDFERRFLLVGGDKPAGMLYDGHRLLAIFAGLLPAEEVDEDHCHVALTNQLLVTWDPDDLRYHARTALYAVPSLISSLGLVEAPAKPREVYLRRMLGLHEQASVGAHTESLQRRDPRMGKAIMGYLLQAVFFHVTGDPFCDDKDCRLYNAHWQRELIHAQLRPGAGLCEKHRRIMENWQ